MNANLKRWANYLRRDWQAATGCLVLFVAVAAAVVAARVPHHWLRRGNLPSPRHGHPNGPGRQEAPPAFFSTQAVVAAAAGRQPPPPPLRLVPAYFKVGAGSEAEASAKWAATLLWRERHGVDSILHQAPSWDFEAVQRLMPTGHIHGKDREGNLVVFDNWRGVDMAGLQARGVGVPELLRHFTWQLEWLWSVAAPREEEVITLVMDIGGISFEMLTPTNVELVKERVRIGCEHWPNRGAGLYMVNVPWWCSLAFRMVAPLLSPATKAKMAFLSVEEVQQGALRRLIPDDQLPKEYGGASKVPLGQSRWDRAQVERFRETTAAAAKAAKSKAQSPPSSLPPTNARHARQEGSSKGDIEVGSAAAAARNSQDSSKPPSRGPLQGDGSKRLDRRSTTDDSSSSSSSDSGEWWRWLWAHWEVEPSEADWEVWEI